MTDIREWSEEGATPEELALLRASRSELPNDAARARTLAALGLGAALGASATTATAMTAGAKATGAATTALGGSSLGAAAKIGIALAVAGAAAGGFALGSFSTRSEPVPSAALAATSAAVIVSPAPSAEPLEVPPGDVETSPKVTVRSAARPANSTGSLADEVAVLEKAQAALAARDPDAALRVLDRYKARFPGGALASEAKVLRVKAEVLRGDKQRAAALANELRESDPNSPFVHGVDDLVSGEEKGKAGSKAGGQR